MRWRLRFLFRLVATYRMNWILPWKKSGTMSKAVSRTNTRSLHTPQGFGRWDPAFSRWLSYSSPLLRSQLMAKYDYSPSSGITGIDCAGIFLGGDGTGNGARFNFLSPFRVLSRFYLLFLNCFTRLLLLWKLFVFIFSPSRLVACFVTLSSFRSSVGIKCY